MTWNRTANQYVVLLREYFYYAQCFDLNPVGTHAACHTHAFEYTARIR